MRKAFALVLAAIGITISSFAQEVAIAEWRVHLPYKSTLAVELVGQRVYCATPNNIFYYDKDDNSLGILSRVNGLSDVNISNIRYSEAYKVLIVGYVNGNIDLIYEDAIINISDIKRKPIYGNKTINNISFLERYAYLSCGFGIVVLDLSRQEIKDTYYIGPNGTSLNVMDLTYDNTWFYAGTEKGIYKAKVNNANLANFANWKRDSTLRIPNGSYNALANFGGKIFANLSVAGYGLDTLYAHDGSGWSIFDSVRIDDIKSIRISGNQMLLSYNLSVVRYNDQLQLQEVVWNYNPGSPEPLMAVFDDKNQTWIADRWKGLMMYYDWKSSRFLPNGPGNNDVFEMAMLGSDLYVAPGGVNSSWSNVWNTSGPYAFLQNEWYILKDHNPALDTLYDIIAIAIDPSDPTHVFAGSFAKGLAEFRNGILVKIHDQTNSGLEQPYSFYNWVGIGGLAFDNNNNLWVVNAGCNSLLKVLRPNGTWESFSMVPYLSQPRAGRLIIDQNGQKWNLLNNTGGILVFTDNGTLSDKSDDKIKVVTTGIGNGNLPSGVVLSIAEDLDGKVWIGTDKGVAVFYNPENIFSGANFDAQVITIMQDSTAQHLLEFETVTAIAVDGSNKKWFGTEKAGVFLMSADGQQQILHFTAENSPLLSNTITSIVIDDNTGEVFFGTASGIISYKYYATKGAEVFENVYAYPNPVREGFTGLIGIKGLVKNATVKITDVSGTLVYETRAEGGQAVWNGTNLQGEKVRTGVYFVLCSSEDGREKLATKILVIH